MSSALDRSNDADGPSSGASTGAGETGSSDRSDITDIRGGVRRAHGFQLTDDNILRAVETTIDLADSVLLAAARAVDAGKDGLRHAAPAAADDGAYDLPAEIPPLLIRDFVPGDHMALQALQAGPQAHRRSLAQWGFAVSASALVAVLIAGNPFSSIKQTTASEPGPSASPGTAAPVAAAPAPVAAAPATVASVAPAVEPRLVVHASERGGSDQQPLALGMTIDHPDNAAGLLIEGLPEGTSLSAGRPSGANQWYVPAADLADAVVHPPRGFTGAMDLSVELQLVEGRVTERRWVRLEWARPIEHNPTPVAAAPTADVTGGLTVRKLSPDEIASLRKRGDEFFANGDVAAARLMLLRAAEAGDARAALALAATYDPIALGDIGIRGAFADAAMARMWYERAKTFGSPDAPHRLELLASREH
jgi:hypothetical protein